MMLCVICSLRVFSWSIRRCTSGRGRRRSRLYTGLRRRRSGFSAAEQFCSPDWTKNKIITMQQIGYIRMKKKNKHNDNKGQESGATGNAHCWTFKQLAGLFSFFCPHLRGWWEKKFELLEYNRRWQQECQVFTYTLRTIYPSWEKRKSKDPPPPSNNFWWL